MPAARAHYTRAIALAPPGYDYRVSMARLDLHAGRARLTRATARPRCWRRCPRTSKARSWPAWPSSAPGHRAEARRYLELAASLAPEYFDVRLALGILDYTESRMPQARGHFEAAFLADPARRGRSAALARPHGRAQVTMPPTLRLALAVATLATFWFGLFVSTAVNMVRSWRPRLSARQCAAASGEA